MTAEFIQFRLKQGLKAESVQQQGTCSPVLSQQEAEVLRRLAAGQETVDIAIHLSVRETAIKEHIKSVLSKVRARTKLDPAEVLTN